MIFVKGDTVRYVGKAFPHLQGLTGVVEGEVRGGFIRVAFAGHTHPKTGRQRYVRCNPRYLDKVETIG